MATGVGGAVGWGTVIVAEVWGYQSEGLFWNVAQGLCWKDFRDLGKQVEPPKPPQTTLPLSFLV